MISDMNIPRKRNIKMRYIGAISDTDILINLAKVNRLDVLDYLFKKIIIPQYVYDFEIKKKAGRYYSTINHAINKDGSIFRVLDRKKDKSINILAKDIIEEMRKVIYEFLQYNPLYLLPCSMNLTMNNTNKLHSVIINFAL